MKKLEGKKQHFEAKVAKIPLCYVNLTCGARPNVSLLNLTLSFIHIGKDFVAAGHKFAVQNLPSIFDRTRNIY